MERQISGSRRLSEGSKCSRVRSDNYMFFTELQADYGYSEQDAMSVLRRFWLMKYMDNRPQKKNNGGK